jgi:chemotaxis signal transduction protein
LCVYFVLDLRLKFGLGKPIETEQTRLIVVQIALASLAVIQVGILVDAVQEAIAARPEEIDITPDFSAKLDTGFQLGMV